MKLTKTGNVVYYYLMIIELVQKLTYWYVYKKRTGKQKLLPKIV